MTSPYELRLTEAARRALTADLPEAIAFAAHAFITGPLLVSPHRVGKALRPPYEGTHSARLGTYRSSTESTRMTGLSSCSQSARDQRSTDFDDSDLKSTVALA